MTLKTTERGRKHRIESLDQQKRLTAWDKCGSHLSMKDENKPIIYRNLKQKYALLQNNTY